MDCCCCHLNLRTVQRKGIPLDTMSKRASKEAMDSLHVQIATVLKDGIAELASAEDKRGLSALMNVARQFLKDNDVTAIAAPASPLQNLAASLPFVGDEFNEDELPRH